MRRFLHALVGPSAIFGSVDGLTVVVGLIAGLAISHQSSSALWHAALSGGLAELVGMTSGQWQSDSKGGWPVAFACGVMAALGCIAPAIPYVFFRGLTALTSALVLVAGVCAFIAWLRPEKGIRAVSQTYGLTVIAGVICALAGLI